MCSAIEALSCKRGDCDNPVPPDRIALGAVYCSRVCADTHRKYTSPSKRRLFFRSSYGRFILATKPAQRVAVKDTPEAQAAARKLIAAGMCAYENAQGLICDIGVPVSTHPARRGRIYSKRDVRKSGAPRTHEAPHADPPSKKEGLAA